MACRNAVLRERFLVGDMHELQQLARKGRLSELETVWMQTLEGEISTCEGFLAAAEVLATHGQAELAESLLWYLINALKDREDVAEALATAQRACQLLPASDVIREEAAELYLSLHGRSEEAQTLVGMTFADESVPLDEAALHIKLVERLRPGTYVRADPGARFGRVERLDPARLKLIVAFEDGEREYDVARAEHLAVVDADDFRALAVFERDRLSAMALDSAEDFLALLLKTFGGRLGLDRLKRLVQPLLGNMTWSKWWAKLKRMAEHSALIGLTGGTKPDVFVRSRPVQREERLASAFDGAPAAEKLTRALDVLREKPHDAEARRALLAHYARGLARIAASAEKSGTGTALAALAVLEEIGKKEPDVFLPERPSADALLAGADVAQAVASTGAEGELAAALLDGVRRWLPDQWQDLCSDAMPFLSRDACDCAADRLAEAGAGELLKGAAERMIRSPDCGAGALMWLWRTCETGRHASVLGEVNPAAVLRQLVAAAASLGRAGTGPKDERKRQIAQIRQILLGGDRAFLRQVIEAAPDEEAGGVLSLVERGTGFSKQSRADLVTIIRTCKPSLFLKARPAWEDDTIYCTSAGLRRRKEDLDKIVNVRLPEVIREIGEAAGFGDLSENAEYTAAVEERQRLSERATVIQEELTRASPIAPDMANVPHVTIGSRVRARNLESGEIETFTFLGPWDAEPADGVYSYKAPLSQAFMGAEVGQTVKFSMAGRQRSWEVIEVGPAPLD